MKTAIHPKYYEAMVTCVCGNSFTVGSTKQTIAVDICAKCHPFYTGEMRFVDTMGRVERFQQKMNAGVKGPVTKKARMQFKKRQEEEEEARRPKSLKEMLDKIKK
jgi:large subunit ribosomal protein L31